MVIAPSPLSGQSALAITIVLDKGRIATSNQRDPPRGPGDKGTIGARSACRVTQRSGARMFSGCQHFPVPLIYAALVASVALIASYVAFAVAVGSGAGGLPVALLIGIPAAGMAISRVRGAAYVWATLACIMLAGGLFAWGLSGYSS